jgi:chemotaxis protein MotB
VLATNVNIHPDGLEFVLKDTDFFEPGTATPSAKFVENMEKVKGLTTGLEDGRVQILSQLYNQSVAGSSPDLASKVASERLDLFQKKVESSLEHSTVDVIGKTKVEDKKDFIEGQAQRPTGVFYVRILQKDLKSDGKKQRKIETMFGSGNADMSVYDNFVKQISNTKKKSATPDGGLE